MDRRPPYRTHNIVIHRGTPAITADSLPTPLDCFPGATSISIDNGIGSVTNVLLQNP